MTRWQLATFPTCGCIVVAGMRRHLCEKHKPPKVDPHAKPKRAIAI